MRIAFIGTSLREEFLPHCLKFPAFSAPRNHVRTLSSARVQVGTQTCGQEELFGYELKGTDLVGISERSIGTWFIVYHTFALLTVLGDLVECTIVTCDFEIESTLLECAELEQRDPHSLAVNSMAIPHDLKVPHNELGTPTLKTVRRQRLIRKKMYPLPIKTTSPPATSPIWHSSSPISSSSFFSF